MTSSTIMTRTIAISGAGSGIGHKFVEHFASDSNTTIHAIDVSFSDDMPKSGAMIHCHTVNITSDSDMDKLSKSLDGQAIDLFIHSAGVRGLENIPIKDKDPGAAETMEMATSNTMKSTMEINVVGSFLLIRALVPNLKKAKAGKVVIMGSRMGSIAANKGGSAYAYRASKAGLNALVKSFSIDVPEIIFTIVHPGRVESRLTPVREPGAIDAEEAVRMMVPMVEGFGKKDSGQFYTREGEEIPW